MPCPYFEPQQVVTEPEHVNARLPLLDEYDGSCHAAGNAFAVPPELRFRCCNHGYSRGCCGHFPADELRSSLRYNVAARTAITLDLICVEEQDYAPLRWHAIQYFIENEQISPEPSAACTRAQVVAFCRAYLKRFPD